MPRARNAMRPSARSVSPWSSIPRSGCGTRLGGSRRRRCDAAQGGRPCRPSGTPGVWWSYPSCSSADCSTPRSVRSGSAWPHSAAPRSRITVGYPLERGPAPESLRNGLTWACGAAASSTQSASEADKQCGDRSRIHLSSPSRCGRGQPMEQACQARQQRQFGRPSVTDLYNGAPKPRHYKVELI